MPNATFTAHNNAIRAAHEKGSGVDCDTCGTELTIRYEGPHTPTTRTVYCNNVACAQIDVNVTQLRPPRGAS